MRLQPELVYDIVRRCHSIYTRMSFGVFKKIDIPSCLYMIPQIKVYEIEHEYDSEVYYVLLDIMFPSTYYYLEYVIGGDRKIRYKSSDPDTYMVFNLEDQTCMRRV